MSERYPRIDSMWFIIALALILYVLPWVFNPTVTLSLGAYDFAEFLAKRPFDNLSYNTILALRGQLLLFTCLLAFSTHRPYFTAHWWAHLFACLLLIIAQLPPLTFFTNGNDLNQQQQAFLALGSAVGALIGLSGLLWKQRNLLILLICMIGTMSVIYGLIHATDIMNDYTIPADFGVGGIALVILYISLALWSLLQIFKS